MITKKMRRLFSFAILMMAALTTVAAIYEPTLAGDDEVCVFFEANGTVTDAPKVWAWEGNTDGRS